MVRTKIQDPASAFFDSVVENAIEFLNMAAHQLKISPKHALINFANAFELFLKARLLIEHWALVVENPREAKITSFRSGDFRSVGAAEAIKRLEAMTGESFTKEEKKCFEELRNHRNRLVHFFHDDYAIPKQSIIDEVTAEQLRAWFYLHKLLTQEWKHQFRNFMGQVDSLDLMLQKNREYLLGKFRALATLRDEIKEEILDAYVAMGSANQVISAVWSHRKGGSSWAEGINEAARRIGAAQPKIHQAKDKLLSFLSSDNELDEAA